MDFKELFEKYQALLVENKSLSEEIKSLKAQYGIGESQGNRDDISEHKPEPEISEQNHSDKISNSSVNNESETLPDEDSSEGKKRGFSRQGYNCITGNIGIVEKYRDKYSFQIKHTPEICSYGSKDSMVWEYKPAKLRHCRRKHHEA